LHQAIDIVHSTGYGLTSGLESLDDREQALWLQRLQAGNLYINRPTTGAIVLRQPFGGMGKSAFGPGIKAGGPNYVIPLMRYADLSEAAPPETGEAERAPELASLSTFYQQLHATSDRAAAKLREHLTDQQWCQLLALIVDYDQFAQQEIRSTHDTLRLLGQDNWRRYLPMTHVRLRVVPSDSWLDIVARAVAVVAVGGRATVSSAAGVHRAAIETLERLTQEWAGDLEFVEESDDDLSEAIRTGQVDRVRYAGESHVPEKVRRAAAESFVYVADQPISPLGRVELLWYVREQSVCIDYHRYGNLGLRADETRRGVL
jgi:RHH-type proline utilization regulon transcriptional repressor/proline dehydrogenase/delta 1-pyrroline-5-carboxylate dehydrogenase